MALLVSLQHLSASSASSLATLRSPDGTRERILLASERPEDVPMAPLGSDTVALGALVAGQEVTLEPAGAAPLSLAAPGLAEGLAQLIRHCGRPLTPATPQPAPLGLAVFAPPGQTFAADTSTEIPAESVTTSPVGVTQMASAPDTPTAVPVHAESPIVRALPSAPRAPLDMEAVDAQYFLWYLAQISSDSRIRDAGLLPILFNALEREVGDRGLTPPGYPPYPTRRSPVVQREAWAEEVMATAGRLNAPPPDAIMIESQVSLLPDQGRLRLQPFNGLVYDQNGIRADTELTLRELAHEIARQLRVVFEVDRPLMLPLAEETIAQFAGGSNPNGFLRIYGALSDHAPVIGGPLRRSATARMSIQRVELLEGVQDGRRLVPGRVMQVWDDSTRQIEDTPPALASDPSPPAISATYGTSQLDGRVLTFGMAPRPLLHARPELAGPPSSRLSRDGSVADSAAALATRLAAIIRAAPERPLSAPVALAVAQSLLTSAERDQLFPPLTFNRNTPQVARDAALRAADTSLKEAVQRLALPSPLGMVEIRTVQTQPYNAQFGVLQVNTPRTERIWIGRLDRPLEYSVSLPMTEQEAMDLHRYRTERGYTNQLVQRLDWALDTPEAPPARPDQ